MLLMRAGYRTCFVPQSNVLICQSPSNQWQFYGLQRELVCFGQMSVGAAKRTSAEIFQLPVLIQFSHIH